MADFSLSSAAKHPWPLCFGRDEQLKVQNLEMPRGWSSSGDYSRESWPQFLGCYTTRHCILVSVIFQNLSLKTAFSFTCILREKDSTDNLTTVQTKLRIQKKCHLRSYFYHLIGKQKTEGEKGKKAKKLLMFVCSTYNFKILISLSWYMFKTVTLTVKFFPQLFVGNYPASWYLASTKYLFAKT